MNIFVLDKNPVVAASMMCDEHLPKMIVESAQMLANCHTSENLKIYNAPRTQKGTVRKHSYYNHPCSKWVRNTFGNYQWLIDHATALADQRRFRNPQCKAHFTEGFIEWCDGVIPDNIQSIDNAVTDFAIAINEDSDCHRIKNFNVLTTVEKYQMFYKFDKPFASWKNSKMPDFMLVNDACIV